MEFLQFAPIIDPHGTQNESETDHLEHFKKCDKVKNQQSNQKTMNPVICKHCSHESPSRLSYWAHLLECDVYLKKDDLWYQCFDHT